MAQDEPRAGRLGWAAYVAVLYGLLAWGGTMLSLQVVGVPWWAEGTASSAYLAVHPLRVLAMAVVGFGVRRAPLSAVSRAVWIGVCAAALEVVANWRDVVGWLFTAQLYWNGADPRFHRFSILPEAALWLGVPCAAGLLSTVLIDWLIRRRWGRATRGPTRG